MSAVFKTLITLLTYDTLDRKACPDQKAHKLFEKQPKRLAELKDAHK